MLIELKNTEQVRFRRKSEHFRNLNCRYKKTNLILGTVYFGGHILVMFKRI